MLGCVSSVHEHVSACFTWVITASTLSALITFSRSYLEFLHKWSILQKKTEAEEGKEPKEEKEQAKPAGKNMVVFVCKYVAVASGHHSVPLMPNYPGQDKFEGE